MFRIHFAAYFALGFMPVCHFPGHALLEAGIHFTLAAAIIAEHILRRRRAARALAQTPTPSTDAPATP
jgi:hypothetical protein